MEMLLKKKNRISSLLIVIIAFLVLYTIVILELAYKINLSEDETYTLNTTSYSLSKVIYQSYHFEGQLPVYFVLLNIWRQLNNSVFFARAFSVLLILLSAFYFDKIIRLISDENNSLWITVLYLTNPFIIASALEIRLYALIILMTVITLYYFLKYYLTAQYKYLIILAIVSLVGMYTQYFYTFLISSLSLIVLIFKGIRPFIKFCLFLLPSILLFLPNLFFISEQYNLHTAPYSGESSLTKISVIYYTIKDFLFAVNQPMINIWFIRVIIVIFCLSLIQCVYILFKNKGPKYERFREMTNLISLLILFIIIHYLIFILLGSIGFSYKYLAIIFPPVIAIFSLFGFSPNIFNKITYVTFLLYYISQSISFYSHPVKSYDFKSIATYIKKIEFVNEPILFYRPGLSLPFQHYYEGNNPIFPLPHAVRFDTNYLINIKDSSVLERTFNRISEGFKSMILISDLSQYEYSINMNRTMIDDYLNSNYRISLDTLYQGWSKEGPLRIRRLERIH
jgi:mannosyltransferase